LCSNAARDEKSGHNHKDATLLDLTQLFEVIQAQHEGWFNCRLGVLEHHATSASKEDLWADNVVNENSFITFLGDFFLLFCLVLF
jgi:hypothetical protein